MQGYQGEQQTQVFIQDGGAEQEYASLPHAAQYGCGQEPSDHQPSPQEQATYKDHQPGDIGADANQQVLVLPDLHLTFILATLTPSSCWQQGGSS